MTEEQEQPQESQQEPKEDSGLQTPQPDQEVPTEPAEQDDGGDE